MHRRRSLALVLTTGAMLALAAPAAQAVTDTTLTFGAGTVRVQDPSPVSPNEVRFTIPNTATTRAFIDIHNSGEAHIALGSQAALGAPHAVYTTQSTAACQVYTGTTFGEADMAVTPAGLVFDVRKDELAPEIGVTLEDSAGGAPDCAGFDGSRGRPVTFAATGPNVTGLDWVAPLNASGVLAVGGPHAITLFWTPPADAVGVRYQVLEDGVVLPVSESVSGSAATFSDLTPGSVHTYRLRAYRFWGGRLFSADVTAPATAVATEFPPPVVPASGGPVTTTEQPVKGATRKSAKKVGARPATPTAFRARATRGRVLISLPKLAKGQRIEIQRAATAKATFGRIATTKARTYLDRKVRRGRTYRYRVVLVAASGSRSLPSTTIAVRVPRR